MESLKNIHIGSTIKQKLTERSMTVTEFADRICCERTTVYDIFRRKSIDIELLIKISEALNYDFVNEVYFQRKTALFSEKILIEIDENAISKLDLPANSIVFRKDKK